VDGKMDKSEQMQYLLSLYLDGQLDVPQATEIERRLAEDAALQRELEAYRLLDAALDELADGVVGVSEDAQRAEIMSAIAERAEPVPRTGHVLRWGFVGVAAAAASVVLAVGLWAWLAGKTPSRPVRETEVAVAHLPGGDPVEGVVTAQPRPARLLDVPLAPHEAEAVPAGTVVVSVGHEPSADEADFIGYMPIIE
jgi:anti-sigma factor RsiW